MSNQFSNFIQRTERSHPPLPEKPPTEVLPPKICDPTLCPISNCPHHMNPNKHGKPCWYYSSDQEPSNSPYVTPPLGKQQGDKVGVKPQSLEQKLEKAVQKVLKPYHDRLNALEAGDRKSITRSFLNGTRQRVDVCMNQSRINDND